LGEKADWSGEKGAYQVRADLGKSEKKRCQGKKKTCGNRKGKNTFLGEKGTEIRSGVSRASNGKRSREKIRGTRKKNERRKTSTIS